MGVVNLNTVGMGVDWGSPVYSKDFGTLGAQDLTSSPTFDTHWTAGHTAAASPFAIVNGSGIQCKPNNGTNWTDSASWTAPYVSAAVSNLLGFTPGRHDWLALILKQSVDSEALFGGSEIFDCMLNYGTSHAGLQNYRNETRTYIATAYNGSGHVRTYGGSQTGGAGTARGAYSRVLELQIRGGLVRSYFGTVMPSAPGTLTENPATPNYASIENNDPSDAIQYDPATDVVAFSCYNFNGAAKTITWEQLDIYHIDMGAVT